MASNTLRYLQNQDDPLNDLLGGGGEPAVPQQPPQPAQQEAPPQPQAAELDQSLLDQNAPPPSAAAPPERVYTEPDPVKMRASYAEPGGGSNLDALLSQKKDPELDAAYRQTQLDALRHTKFDDSGYGVGEAVRDNGAALLASILDIGFNKGRGLGGIVSATANEVGKQEAARAADRKQAQDFALRMHQGNKAIDPFAAEKLQLSIDRLGQQKTNEEGKNTRFGTARADKLPDSAVYQAGVQKAGDVRTAQLDAAHAVNPRTAADQAAITGAKTTAELAAQHEGAPVANQDAADRAAGVAGAQQDIAHAYAPQNAADAGQKSQAEASGTVAGQRAGQSANRPIPAGFHVENGARWDDLTQDPVRYREALADTQMANQLQSSADQLDDIRKKYGPQALPSAGSGEYNALHLAVLGAANRVIGQAGTVNAGERQLMESMIPGIKPNWGDLFGWLKGSNLNAQQLEGFAKGLQAVLNARASSYGLGIGEGEAPPSAADAMPQVRPASPDNLGPPQPAPKVNKAIGAGTQPIRNIVNTKTGKVSQTMMTDEQLAPAISSGMWKLVP